MWSDLVFSVLAAAYRNGGRSILARAVENPDYRWDDYMLQALDAVLGYYKEESYGEKPD